MPVRLQTAPNIRSDDQELSSRQRSWLLSPYEDSVWIVEDGVGKKRTRTISFIARMADGRMLTDHPRLLATAKELTFWIRAGPYTRIDDADRHAYYGNTVVRMCYGLTARGIFSFADINSVQIDSICEEAAFGVDGLTGASKIVREALAQYTSWDNVPKALAPANEFDLTAAISEFNLPENWARREIKSELAVATARLNGKALLSIAQAKTKPLAVTGIQTITAAFDALFSLRRFIRAPAIKFRPFPEGPSKKAYELGRPADRTPIAHPDLVLSFLQETMRYVAVNSDDILARYHAIVDNRSRPDEARLPLVEARKQIHHLVTACYILIAAFTARRAAEIKLLEWNCVAGNDEAGWWMKIYIVKTERQQTWIPIPSIVARAVKALSALNNKPTTGDEGELFRYYDPSLEALVDVRPEKRLNEFAKLVGAHEHANDNGDKKPWHWTTRQFRRFFAVLFFHRYKGKKETLAHHLRHFNIEMTNDYVTLDPEVDRIWHKELSSFQVEISRDIVEGKSVYTGPMGDWLNKLVKRIRAAFEKKLLIVPSDMVHTLLRSMKKHHLVITPKPWVNCTCPRNRNGAEKAACRKLSGVGADDVGPDFAAAGPTVCPNCPWALLAKSNLEYFDQEIEAAKAGFIDEHQPTIFGELQAAKIVSMGSYRAALSPV
jgi:integrase